ncbi:hypothetical protein BGW42_007259 [Actinomortierella wolfii]|nr:hypothetical protein BGW42_007259 [Actinomortierella wolfii]
MVHHFAFTSYPGLLDARVVDDLNRVIERYSDYLDENSEARPDYVYINGIGDDAAAPLEINMAYANDHAVWEFTVDTEGKPYDIAVCVALLILEMRYAEEFDLTTRSPLSDWEDAVDAFNQIVDDKIAITGGDDEEYDDE